MGKYEGQGVPPKQGWLTLSIITAPERIHSTTEMHGLSMKN